MKLKKGDTVVVIAGKDKGQEGEVIRVLPTSNQVIVNGIWHKPWGHGLAEGDFAVNRAMNEIGG